MITYEEACKRVLSEMTLSEQCKHGDLLESVIAAPAAEIYANAAREEERGELNIWHPASELPVVPKADMVVELLLNFTYGRSSRHHFEFVNWYHDSDSLNSVTINNPIAYINPVSWCYTSDLLKQAGVV